jgi:hypothetical protein
MQKIDYAELLGFDAVCDDLSEGIDFQDVIMSAKLGAKVGAEVLVTSKLFEIPKE